MENVCYMAILNDYCKLAFMKDFGNYTITKDGGICDGIENDNKLANANFHVSLVYVY